MYDEYTVTPVPWIERMPAHWELIRGKNLYEKMQRPVQDSDEVITCFRDGTVTLRKNRRTTGFTESLKEVGYQGIRMGDLVIHVMDAFAGSIGVSDSNGKGTPVYSVCQSKRDCNSYYYAFLLREMARTGYIQSLYRGIRERSSDFRFEVFAAQFYPVPPREEQDQIVRFLDWKVSAINRLISAKKKEIALLNEIKRTRIESALSYGIHDETVITTGNPWLPVAPKSWRKMRHKNVLTEKKEFVGDKASEYTLLSLTTNGVIVRDIESGKGKFPSDFSTYQIVEHGDMVFCLFDVDETPRTVGLSEHSGMITGAYSVFVPHDAIPEYLYFYFLAIDNKKGFRPLYSGLRKVVGKDIFMRQSIYLPSAEEQAELVKYLKLIEEKTQTVINSYNREIENLYEFRNKLISDVVTGQIDVRDIEVPDFEYVREDADGESEENDESSEGEQDEE